MSDSTGNPAPISDDSTPTTSGANPSGPIPTGSDAAPAPTASGSDAAPTPAAPTASDDTTAVVPPIVPPVQAPAQAPVSATATQPTTPYPAQGYGAAQPAPHQSAPHQAPQHQPAQPYGQAAAYTAPQQAAHYGNGSFGTPNTAPQYRPAPDPAFNSALYSASGAYTAQPAQPKAPKKRRGGVALVAALAIGALIGGASGAGVTAWVVSQNGDGGTTSASSPTSITVNNPDDANLVTAVAAKASPSVVTISVASDEAAGTGSGVILSDDGYVVTNTHVVTLDGATNAPDIQVQTNDGKLYAATIVGTDPVADLAVIKLTDASGLTPIEFSDSSELNVGDVTIAIGAPLGLAGTVTNGIVSALNRSITVASSAAPDDTETNPSPDQEGEGEQGPYDFWNFDIPGQEQQQTPQQSTQQQSISLSVIQTDAAINPGNSGGALLDSEGKLIGVNVAIASAGSSGESGNIGVGFSIPSNLVKRVTDEIIENGSATHGLLGATVGDAAAAEDSTTAGALIQSVTEGGAAEKAGLAAGDVVTEFNGLPVTDSIDLTALVRTQAAGADATLTYTRGGDSKTVDVTLGQLAS